MIFCSVPDGIAWVYIERKKDGRFMRARDLYSPTFRRSSLFRVFPLTTELLPQPSICAGENNNNLLSHDKHLKGEAGTLKPLESANSPVSARITYDIDLGTHD